MESLSQGLVCQKINQKRQNQKINVNKVRERKRKIGIKGVKTRGGTMFMQFKALINRVSPNHQLQKALI